MFRFRRKPLPTKKVSNISSGRTVGLMVLPLSGEVAVVMEPVLVLMVSLGAVTVLLAATLRIIEFPMSAV